MEQITKYFNAEKSESLLFLAVGFISLELSLYFILNWNILFTTAYLLKL